MSDNVTRKNKNWLAGVMKNFRQLDGKEIVVGFPLGKQNAYPDGESVVEVAARHVFGIGVVQRDFMSYALDDINQKTKPILKRIVQLNNQGDYAGANKLMKAAGEVGAQAIKDAVINGIWTPNSDNPMGVGLAKVLTVKWGQPVSADMSYREAKMKIRGSDKPLIDTAHMVNSVTYDVRKASK